MKVAALRRYRSRPLQPESVRLTAIWLSEQIREAAREIQSSPLAINLGARGRHRPARECREKLFVSARSERRIVGRAEIGVAGVAEDIEPTKSVLPPARRCSDHAASDTDREVLGATRAQSDRGRSDRARAAIGERVEERRVGEAANEPAEIETADACVVRVRAANQKVRKPGCVIAEDERVVDARAPPLVLGAESDGDRTCIEENGRLARPQSIY